MGEGPITMKEVPAPPPPVEPPPVVETSSGTDGMMLAAVRPFGHEGSVEISRTEFV